MTTLLQPGPDNDITINGVMLPFPGVLELDDPIIQGMSEAGADRRVNAWYVGDGMPNVCDLLQWSASYEIADSMKNTNAFLARLRSRGGVQLFADWKARSYTYTARSGQQFFYLPRQDAFSMQYVGAFVDGAYNADHTNQNNYGAKVIYRNASTGVETALTVTYKATVASGDAVPAGNVWISNSTIRHPESNYVVAPFKVGTTLTVFDEIVVEFHPLYRVLVIGSPVEPFEKRGREDRSLILAETRS